MGTSKQQNEILPEEQQLMDKSLTKFAYAHLENVKKKVVFGLIFTPVFHVIHLVVQTGS
jgi:hypothetical protein